MPKMSETSSLNFDEMNASVSIVEVVGAGVVDVGISYLINKKYLEKCFKTNVPEYRARVDLASSSADLTQCRRNRPRRRHRPTHLVCRRTRINLEF